MKKITLFLSALVLFSLNVSLAGNGGTSTTYKKFVLPDNVTELDYKAGILVLRLKPEHRSVAALNRISLPSLQAAFEDIGVTSIKKMFPSISPPDREKNNLGQSLADISLIYELSYSTNYSVVEAANRILSTGTVLYAEPKYIFYAKFAPNDPSIGNTGQYFINKIKCDSAWGVNTSTARGDTNVVIGIIDTGTDWDHPDLINNVKLNFLDPIDGIDNDGDGYVDNYRGWDLGEDDNDPMVNANNHGAAVSGDAAASTNNGVGVASPGFKCKFLPVKIADAAGTLTMGYEGITYASTHGARIINCSWGGPGSGNLGLDVVTFASVNMDCAIFASAGNDGLLMDLWPASYPHVYSIASTASNDKKSSFSNYGYSIDMSAPGSNIYSTTLNTYASSSGTSMASPVAAGAAGIVKSFYGATYNSIQVAEKLRVTCDNVELIQSAAHKDKIGKGRINLYRAITATTPSVRMINIVQTDFNDEVFVIGDTVRILGDFINYLDPTSNLSVTLSSAATAITILNPTITPGVIGTLASFSTNSNPFSFVINPVAVPNSIITFKLTFSDGSYTDLQYVISTVNVDYINIAINQVHTTNTSKGNIGYNADGQSQGLGFAYMDSSLLYESGLMIGTASKVMDNVRGDAAAPDNDFLKANVIIRDSPFLISDLDLKGSFTDNGAGSGKLGLTVNHRSFAFDSLPWSKFVIFRYTIVNTNTSGTINDLYAGIFNDWDITSSTFQTNKGAYDAANKMGYTYNVGSALYAGTQVLSPGGVHSYAIDNTTGGNGGMDVSAGFTSALKFQAMSTDRFDGGGTAGEDILQVVSTGPFNIAAGDSITVSFALIAGNSLADLQTSAIETQKIENFFFPASVTKNGIEKLDLQIFPNPAKNSARVEFRMQKSTEANIEIFDIAGQKIYSKTDFFQSGIQTIELDLSNLSSGIYTLQVNNGTNVNTKKLIINK